MGLLRSHPIDPFGPEPLAFIEDQAVNVTFAEPMCGNWPR